MVLTRHGSQQSPGPVIALINFQINIDSALKEPDNSRAIAPTRSLEITTEKHSFLPSCSTWAEWHSDYTQPMTQPSRTSHSGQMESL